MATSQLLMQEKIFWQLLAQDSLRTKNKWVRFQSLSQFLPDGQDLQEGSKQTSVMQKAIVNIKNKLLGSTLDTELWLTNK